LALDIVWNATARNDVITVLRLRVVVVIIAFVARF